MNANRREWLLVLLVSTLVLVWSSIPLWRGYALQNEKVSFTGAFLDTRDYAVHIAMLRAGTQGEWAYRFRFTAEPHRAYYIRIFYLALGEANRLLHLDPETLFQLARWFFGYCSLFALFALVSRIFESRRSRWLAFILAVLGSGFGYFQLMFGWVPGPVTPVDLWLIDAYMLLSLAVFPHFAFTLALMSLALALYWDYLRTGAPGKIAVIAALALLVQFVNPIAFVLVDVAMAAATITVWWRDRALSRNHILALTMLALVQVPLLAYNSWILASDPIWIQYTAQNVTLSPPPPYYLWGFGLLWPLAILGAWRALQERQPFGVGAVAWIMAAFLLAYAPFAIQRRFLLGVTIPFAILGTAGFEVLWSRAAGLAQGRRARVPAASVLVVIFICMTSILFSPAYTIYLQGRPPEYYYPHSLDRAFAWVIQNTGEEDFVLGAEDTGRLIAQKTGRPVYLGHPMETLNYAEKVKEVSAFYRGELTTEWLANSPVRWVVYGPYEQALAPDFRASPALELVFQQNGISIYRVGKVRAMLDSGPAHDRSP